MKFDESTYRVKILNGEIKLLGQIPVSDDEYMELKNDFIEKIFQMDMDKQIDLTISVFLVQTAIKEFGEFGYWEMLSKAINRDISQRQRQIVCETFMDTIYYFELFRLPSESSSQIQYVENIKAHAFVTNNYMDIFFDFVYSFYDTVLYRQLDQKEFYDDISDIKEFMKSTLKENDIILTEGNEKIPKTYCLLKSTKNFLAYADADTINFMLYPILKMIDDYYYDDVIPNNGERFGSAFKVWCEKRNKSEIKEKTHKSRLDVSRRPFLKFEPQLYKFILVIPQQKFRTESDKFDGDAYTAMNFGGDNSCDKKINLDISKHLGTYISDEMSIRINSPFDEINIQILGLNNCILKEYFINSSLYRIIDEKNKVINKLKDGVNKILVSEDTEVEFKFAEVQSNFSIANIGMFYARMVQK